MDGSIEGRKYRRQEVENIVGNTGLGERELEAK